MKGDGTRTDARSEEARAKRRRRGSYLKGDGTRIDARSEEARRLLAMRAFGQPTPTPAKPPTSTSKVLLNGDLRTEEEAKKTIVINIQERSPMNSREGIAPPNKKRQFVITASPQYDI